MAQKEASRRRRTTVKKAIHTGKRKGRVLETLLEGLARFQFRFGILIVIAALVMSVFMGIGIRDIEMESDFNAMMPQHLPIFQLNEKITDTFSGQDTVFILFKLDEDVEMKGAPTDILDPLILQYIQLLDSSLKHENAIDSVLSLAPAIDAAERAYPELTTEAVLQILDSQPQLKTLISDDRKKMIVMLKADVGSGDEGIIALEELVQNKLDALSCPPGTDVMITGSPSVRVVILDLLRHDAIYTLIIAFIIIFLLLIVMERSLRESIIISIPLLLGILWTGGTLAWLDIKISFATAGLGAMLLGLGVEYGVFMLKRFREERAKRGSDEEAFLEAVPKVGSAILGSGTTTIVGFLALTLSILPMMQNLGFSLALGIFYSIIVAVVIEPVIIRFDQYVRGRQR